MLTSLRPSCNLPLRRFICKIHHSPSFDHPQLPLYKESFAKRMAMAGIKPHHRIALGVSGGPDSTALCVLATGWKSDCLARNEGSGYIDGLLGIVVDHRLRPESGDEADLVRNRVSKMGIRCVVECCDWSKGKPKLGHLQEAARDMRYRIFQRVCMEQQIGVLLIAHHADDQVLIN
ncbi:tRNA(Ile)-lysidine synthase [Asparagus officinalis]|uniref:tRNA(Ile)-lysidine synthetase n=1 Tax=Asparagus officinalis TaxID=4686 RepID=A0A5P1EMZ8_ASPOF|nr:tRNA(Ile)-lysidine synthase [Asparagus officinalis]